MPEDEKTCPNCSGDGEVTITEGGIRVTCAMCCGSGTVPK